MFAVDFKNEDEVKEYLKNLATEYSFQCYHEKTGDGCYRLGQFLVSTKKEYKEAARAFKMGCEDLDHGKGCAKLAAFHTYGRGVEKDTKKAETYFTKGCQLGDTNSCYGLGLLYTSKKLCPSEKLEVEKGLEAFEKACKLKDKESCFRISTVYLQGLGDVKKDMHKAFTYASRSCTMDHMYACSNLSMMYSLGAGTEKNEEFAKKYRSRAEEIRKEWDENKTQMTFGGAPKS